MFSKDWLQITLDFFNVDFVFEKQTSLIKQEIYYQIWNFKVFWKEYFKNYTFEQWNFLTYVDLWSWWHTYQLEWLLSWDLINEKTKLLYVHTLDHKNEVFWYQEFSNKLNNVQFFEIKQKLSIYDCDYEDEILEICKIIKENKKQNLKTILYFDCNTFFFMYLKRTLNNQLFNAWTLIFEWFHLFSFYFKELSNLKQFCKENDAIFWIRVDQSKNLKNIELLANNDLKRFITLHKSYNNIFWSISITYRSIKDKKNVYWIVTYKNEK